MKWTNRGHEFDELGLYMEKTDTIYLYGCVPHAKPLIEQTEWAIRKAGNSESAIEFVFVDKDVNKQGKPYLEKRVISPEQFYDEFTEYYGIVVMCVSDRNSAEVWKQLEKRGINRRFHAYSIFEFHRYMSLFLYHRNKKIYLHFIDILVHTNCNISCENCYVQSYRGVRKKIELPDLKNNIDLVFSKADFVGIVAFGIGDGFCGGDVMEYALKYITENYPDRFMTIELVTNGTIVPRESLIQGIKNEKVRIAVDDYRDNVELARQNYDKVIATLENNNVNFSSLKRDYWYVSAFGKGTTSENEEQLCSKYWNCINEAKGFPYIGYKSGTNKMYSCVFQAINAYLNLIEEKEKDGVDLATAEPIEIIEFLLGYAENGYLSACTNCNGMFEGVDVNHVPVAVQLKGKYHEEKK